MDIRYSAEVDMWLECPNDVRVPLLQVASTFVIAANPFSLAACEAMIVITLDGKPSYRPVQLISGMSRDNAEVMILSKDNVSPF